MKLPTFDYNSVETTRFLFQAPSVNTAWKNRGVSLNVSGKESAYQCRRRGLDLWVGKIPWRRRGRLTPVFLPGKSHGSPAGHSPVGHSQIWLSKWTAAALHRGGADGDYGEVLKPVPTNWLSNKPPKTILMCSICQYPWGKYSHHDQL